MVDQKTRSSPDTTQRRRWLGMIVLSFGVAMIMVDATIVNVAVPSIIRELHLSTTDAEWVNSIYSLVFAALLISLGRAGDLFGRRKLFIIGTIVFALASVLAARAGNGAELVAGRTAQGIGAAMILPATLSTVNATFTGRERTIAFGIWGSTIGGMAAVGPVLGGWLTTDFSWRWAFLINVPIAILIVSTAFTWIRETTDAHARRGADIIGVLTSALGFGALVFALIEGQRYGWYRPTATTFTVGPLHWPDIGISPVPIAFAIAVLCLVLFVLVERRRRRADRAILLDLTLFTIPSFRNGNIAASIVSLGEFGLLFALPLFVQNVLGFSAIRTGLILLALAMGSFVAGPIAATLSHKLGARTVVRIGMLLEVLGIAGIGFVVEPGMNGWLLVPPLFVYGAGIGLAVAQLTSVILADVPVAQSGLASGTQSTCRQIGSALGVAILGMVLVGGLGTNTAHQLQQAGVPQATAIATGIRGSAGTSITALRGKPQTARALAAVETGITQTTRQVAYTAAGFVLLGLLTTTALGGRRRTDTADEVPNGRDHAG
jgi:EmrB/QacA subfamily drug resistance transporter